MKIELWQNYLDVMHRIGEIDKELQLLEEKLKTPERTLNDIINHIKLIKERNALMPF